MKSNQGIIDDKEMMARRRFWNKKGFFGEPTKKQIERSSMKMQKLVKALKAFPFERVMEIRTAIWTNDFSPDMHTVRNASESDFNHAISTFKIFRS